MDEPTRPSPAPQPTREPVTDDIRRTLGLGRRQRIGRIVRRVLGLLVVAGLVAAAVFWFKQRGKTLPTRYETAAVTRADLRVTVTATGTVNGRNTVEVGTEISGKIATLTKDFNDPVSKGELIAEIDTEQLQAAVNEAEAQLGAAKAAIAQAKATAKEAKLAVARAEVQAKQGLISTAEREGAQAATERARATVRSSQANEALAQAGLDAAKSRLGKARIVSPIDGLVLARLVEPGQTVVAGMQTPVLFKIAEDLTHMELTVAVDEADVGRVAEGQAASFTVDAYPDRTFPSQVLSLHNEPTTSQNVVTYEAILSADNPDLLLRPGMTATATITAELREGVLLVPNAALRFTPPVPRRGPRGPGGPGGPGGSMPQDELGGTDRVFLLVDGAPKPAPVHPGATDGTNTELREGDLPPDAQVITGILEGPP